MEALGHRCLSARRTFPLLPLNLEEMGMGRWSSVGIGMDLQWAVLPSAGLDWKGGQWARGKV